MNLIELAKMKLLSGGGGSSGGTAEKVYLFKDVECTSTGLATVDAIPEAGKYYVFFIDGEPKGLSTLHTGSGTLRFYELSVASVDGTLTAIPLLYYKSGDGWTCNATTHSILKKKASVVEYT